MYSACQASILRANYAPFGAVNGAKLSNGMSMEPSAEMAGNTPDVGLDPVRYSSGRFRSGHPNQGFIPTEEQRRKAGRSRISNSDDLLNDVVDKRSTICRRYRDLISAILADQSGADQCSEARKQLIRRFAAASVLAEQLEARLANGEQINIQEHATLSSTLVRLAARIGIDRRMKNIVPSLDEYLSTLMIADKGL
jgi:hypothetical protein